jgi:CheY-like chemotaxis protein
MPAPAARILLVEDDDAIRFIAAMALRTLGGHEVLPVASGPQAIAEAAAFAPQLLLLDVSMPGMDGPETLAALRAQPALQSVPAVFLTARTQAQEVAQLRSLGAVDVIAKPFEPAELVERIQGLL